MLIIAANDNRRHHFSDQFKHDTLFIRVEPTDSFFQDAAPSFENTGETGFTFLCQNDADFTTVMGRASDALKKALFFQPGNEPHHRRMLQRKHSPQSFNRTIGFRSDLYNRIASGTAELDSALDCNIHLVAERTGKDAENIFDEFIG